MGGPGPTLRPFVMVQLISELVGFSSFWGALRPTSFRSGRRFEYDGSEPSKESERLPSLEGDDDAGPRICRRLIIRHGTARSSSFGAIDCEGGGVMIPPRISPITPPRCSSLVTVADGG